MLFSLVVAFSGYKYLPTQKVRCIFKRSFAVWREERPAKSETLKIVHDLAVKAFFSFLKA